MLPDQGFPTDSVASTATLAFHAGIASILVLYSVFWLWLTLIDTLLPLLCLSTFTFLAGFKALSHHARLELSKAGAGSAAPAVSLKHD